MAKRGRPPMPKYDIEFMKTALNDYIEKTDLPILNEALYLNDWDDTRFYEIVQKSPELAGLIKKLKRKKEVALELGGLTGKYDKTVAIFSLKQLGWRDKFEPDTAIQCDANMQVTVVPLSEEDAERVQKIKEGLFQNDKN